MGRGYERPQFVKDKEMLSGLGTPAAANFRDDLANSSTRGKGQAKEQNSTLRNNFQYLNSPHSCG